MGKLFNVDTLKLSKEEKKNLNRLEPKPSIRGTADPKVAKIKSL